MPCAAPPCPETSQAVHGPPWGGCRAHGSVRNAHQTARTRANQWNVGPDPPGQSARRRCLGEWMKKILICRNRNGPMACELAISGPSDQYHGYCVSHSEGRAIQVSPSNYLPQKPSLSLINCCLAAAYQWQTAECPDFFIDALHNRPFLLKDRKKHLRRSVSISPWHALLSFLMINRLQKNISTTDCWEGKSVPPV